MLGEFPPRHFPDTQAIDFDRYSLDSIHKYTLKAFSARSSTDQSGGCLFQVLIGAMSIEMYGRVKVDKPLPPLQKSSDKQSTLRGYQESYDWWQ